MIPILTQSPTVIEAVTETVSNAIDSGLQGIAVLLIVVLIILGLAMGLLILRVIVPLLKQSIQLTGQVSTMVERTSTAIEHSNETGTLQTQATNFQTGVIQGVDKNIVVLGEKFEMLGRNFSAFGTLQSDTTAALVERFDTFDAQLAKIDGLKLLIETSHGDHADIKKLLIQMVEGMHVIQTDIRLLIPAPSVAPTQIELTVKQPDPAPAADTDGAKDAAGGESGERRIA